VQFRAAARDACTTLGAAGHAYDASTPTGMIDEMGLPVAGNQDPPKSPKPQDLDIDEPRIIDRKKDK
jgi:hypothetical protein